MHKGTEIGCGTCTRSEGEGLLYDDARDVSRGYSPCKKSLAFKPRAMGSHCDLNSEMTESKFHLGKPILSPV